MYSRSLETLRLLGRYALVAAVFAFWGAVAGSLIVFAHWDETTLTILAVVLGGATAFPVWERFAPPRPVFEEEQTVWVSFPKTTRMVPIAATLLVTTWAAQMPISQSAVHDAQSASTTAQNVL